MKIAFFYSALLYMTMTNAQPANNCIQLSQDLLYAARTGEPADEFKKQLAVFSFSDLQEQLKDDERKIAFWLNIYNAFTQTGLSENPHWYKKRNKFFKRKFIRIAGKNFSLDLIEHGILRRSKIKLSLGYLNKLFPSSVEKKLRTAEPDKRIHFALNCGAKSCPPVAFYKPEQINAQLDIATKAYLKTEVTFNGKERTVELPAIFSWFRGDFGGKKEIIRFLQQRRVVPENVYPGIIWKKYDWSLALKNFSE